MEGIAVNLHLISEHGEMRTGAVDPRINALRQMAAEPIRDDVRAITVCKAVEDADLARLATSAVVTKVPAGQCFVAEGEPAEFFFVVTAGTAKLFKLLPDGRRQIIRFVGPGQFFGLAVSDIYSSAPRRSSPCDIAGFSVPSCTS
jgi:CRP-like cAMP-binding protein